MDREARPADQRDAQLVGRLVRVLVDEVAEPMTVRVVSARADQNLKRGTRGSKEDAKNARIKI